MTNLTVQDRNDLVMQNISLAEKIAKSKKKNLSHIYYEELKSAAYLGLVEAANLYNPCKNENFAAYAIWRIIGAVRDYLRELSWGSRKNPVKMEDILAKEEFVTDVQVQEGFFEEIIKNLPSINKHVLRLYYQDNMKIKEIASNLNVHQTRISQILTNSKTKLNCIWKDRELELKVAA